MKKKDLFEKIKTLLERDRLIVCISGASCCGKTYLAKEIAKEFSAINPTTIHEDDWYKDIADINRGIYNFKNMEDKQAFHIQEFKDDVNALRTTGRCLVPTYDVMHNRRVSKEIEAQISNLLIVEGLHAVEILKDLDSTASVLYVFIDEDHETCAQRRAHRDSMLVDIEPAYIKRHYRDVVMPNYQGYYTSQKAIVQEKSERGVLLND